MLPFQIQFKSGQPVYEQVIYAVKKALVAGALRPGDRFPSVRQLSQELKINPNTAHKVVSALANEGILEIVPGIGTLIAKAPVLSGAGKRELLSDEIERLVVEAGRFSLELQDLTAAITHAWHRLNKSKS